MPSCQWGPTPEPTNSGMNSMGNMTTRDEAGSSWIQPFTADGRLESVTDQGNSDEWGFFSDGDGAGVWGSRTPTELRPCSSREAATKSPLTTPTARKSRFVSTMLWVGNKSVNNSNYFLLTDHLGSVVGIADGSGNLISQQRYMPYGLPRLVPGIAEMNSDSRANEAFT